ncbi:acetyltransferase GNAT Family protein [Streptococcus equi subsp. zooepidemicus Sz35]|uniref:GNAT family N-acetyltransferase n=1 Tax=Streptococcus equi TaxID=1336 RepID=UPI0005B84DBB|nr:GNAT family N-acetyltransferase [Streptococcus equi]KIS19720.1 acetyltransferase GNAT Family protein [Streptococcus equi subsp. zooepidemicus Sz35]MCD3402669.1 GNAT family N-acetyltransferase [Streptococcus equi subsp. zooepidemicus]HEK9981698.1 GNAT family N-acetyltransferase [Streptococcus equi subsp. zooepidemicus]HEL0562184.1 GNAT family N-acetyltransferase [Streptococcus equi subsp. zooepidemicus]HEL0609480.1 GNAT family N-acetyltransferase [Streptococcus equi subsp. zooepidemicus]
MVKQRVDRIASQLDELTQKLYLTMVPEYQEGYANYVYQTDQPAVQRRRIKHMNKTFHRLLSEPSFYLMPMTQHSAEIIAHDWIYSPAYECYSMTADSWDYQALLSPQARGDHYFQVLRNGVLFGFASFFEQESELEIGLGMVPDAAYQEDGASFLSSIEAFASTTYPQETYVLNVASFNKGAQSLYQKMGYQPTSSFEQYANGSSHSFVRMEKKKQP